MVSTCVCNFCRLAAKVSRRSNGLESVCYIQSTEQSWEADGAGARHVWGFLQVPFCKCHRQWWVGMEPLLHLRFHLHAWPTQALVCQVLNLQWNELCNPMISCQLKSAVRDVKCPFFFFEWDTKGTVRGNIGVATANHRTNNRRWYIWMKE